jgi:hypothetical protein
MDGLAAERRLKRPTESLPVYLLTGRKLMLKVPYSLEVVVIEQKV